jgi:DNA-binding MarR family transcriptional regulator
MSVSQNLAHELDRVARMIDAKMHKMMPKVDHAKIGPMGSLLLMQLETMQPCSIQSLATAMGRDNSQLTRLLRDLESKGVVIRYPSPTDGRITLLELTDRGAAFLADAKAVLTEAVDDIVGPLEEPEKAILLSLLRKI